MKLPAWLTRRREPAPDPMKTGLLPDKHGGLWIYDRGWHHGPDTPVRRARAYGPDACPHRNVIDVPMFSGPPRRRCRDCFRVVLRDSDLRER